MIGILAGPFAQDPAVRKAFLENLSPGGSPGIDGIGKRPTVALQPHIVHTSALIAITHWTKLHVARKVAILGKRRLVAEKSVVQPVAGVRSKQAATIPTIAFGIQRGRLQPRGPRNRRP